MTISGFSAFPVAWILGSGSVEVLKRTPGKDSSHSARNEIKNTGAVISNEVRDLSLMNHYRILVYLDFT
jgi:hypothetical protein